MGLITPNTAGQHKSPSGNAVAPMTTGSPFSRVVKPSSDRLSGIISGDGISLSRPTATSGRTPTLFVCGGKDQLIALGGDAF